MDITPDEIMVVCISHLVNDGEVIVQGLATPLVAAALLLAKRTHAPNLYFASAIGQGICMSPVPIGLSHIEALWLSRNIKNISFTQVALEILPWLKPKEFFRPAQVDLYGNFNNIALGNNYHMPRLRLPGTGGIPDMTVFSMQNYLYVPRHSRITFVSKLDFTSGMGHTTQRVQGKGPICLISDLGQFDFHNGKMRLKTIHPGVTLQHIQSRTGFIFDIAPDLTETSLPTKEEISLLRSEVDPLGIRRLELAGGAVRKDLLRQILDYEKGNFKSVYIQAEK